MTKIPDAAVQAALNAYCDCDSHDELDPMRDALTAAYPHLPIGYEVKKLEWVEANFDDKAVKFFARHDNIDVQYYIIDSRDFVSKDAEPNFTAQGLRGKSTVHYSDCHKTIEEAKAAAQADFERRVRECVVEGSNAQGWLYFNEDTGTEYSADHPIISGECQDAQDIKPATNENLLHELLSSWKAWAEDRQEIAGLRAEIAVKPVDVSAVREVPVNIDKLIAELKSSEDICFSWARSALLANELNALDTEEAHIDLYQALCRLGNVMAYVQSELRALSTEPAQGEQWQSTKQSIRNILESYVDAGMQLADNLDDISNEILRLPNAPNTEEGQ